MRSRSATSAAAVITAAVLTLAGCSTDGDETAQDSPSGVPNSATNSATSSPSDSASEPGEPMDGVSPGGDAAGESGGEHGEGDGHDHGDLVVAGAGADASAAAVEVLRTWARPDLTYAQWWEDLRPLLSAAGQQAYAATDPAAIPRLQVLDTAGRVVEEEDVWARVAVETDAGRFHLELTRSAVAADEQGGWRASRIDFPRR